MPIFALIQQIISMFLMMTLGYLVVRLGILESRDSKILSLICIYIIVPCVNINAFQLDFDPNIMEGFAAAVALSMMLHVILLPLGSLLGKGLHLSAPERLSVIYPNAGNLVIPVVAALFGHEYVIYASAYSSVQLCFLWSHGQSVMSGEQGLNWKKILTNVNLVSVLAGLAMFLCRIKLPTVMANTAASIAGVFAPVSMIMIGMMIAGTPVKNIVQNKRIYLVAALRLLAIPLAAMVVLTLAGMVLHIENQQTILTIVLMALITPAAATVTQLAQLHDNQPDYCSAINVMTTLFCLVTMPLMLTLWGML